jgi:hypothetical protein
MSGEAARCSNARGRGDINRHVRLSALESCLAPKNQTVLTMDLRSASHKRSQYNDAAERNEGSKELLLCSNILEAY